jgi:hypothetical protein
MEKKCNLNNFLCVIVHYKQLPRPTREIVVFMGFNVSIKIFMVQKHEDCKNNLRTLYILNFPSLQNM